MRKLALGTSPSVVVGDEKPFASWYRCMFGVVTSPLAGVQEGDSWHMHHYGLSTQIFTCKESTLFFIYKKLEKPTRNGRRYSQEEEERFALEVGDSHVTPLLKIRDVIDRRQWSVLTDLDEGIVEHFHGAGRIALVGDAIIKQAPNLDQGWNSGVQDVVVLTIKLRELVVRKLEGGGIG
ncbi:hypothetical protein B0T17DRAFT_369168 [Bombardia bombarda]|uniref:FAD-binding domain-containing protein n=1 Tax=Bombardia bombarda TaxID=252184 RepID=A0AA39WIN7_9PEZI|nr:hypothetical protein B0T17DRAFT_369168 [Bombardia bombarda]